MNIIIVSKKFLSTWQRLVHVTMVELELTKSCYLLLAWKLQNGTEALSTIKDEPGSLNLQSDENTGLDVELRRNSVHGTERLLWARLALDGGGEVEYSFRLDQAKALPSNVSSSPFSRYDTEVIYIQKVHIPFS